MSRNELKWSLETRINEKFNGSITLSFQNIIGNNGSRDYVTVRKKGNRTAPTILFDTIVDMYKSCSSIDDIVDYLVNLTMSTIDKDIELPSFDNEEDFKKLRVAMISKERNEKLLQTIPNIPIPETDLVAILKYAPSSNFVFTVSNDIVRQLPNVDSGMLFEAAFKNLNEQHILFEDMSEYLSAVAGNTVDIDENVVEYMPLYILQNADTISYGAAIMLKQGCLEYIRNAVGDFYILPSSVHELLILPKYDNLMQDVSDLLSMVRDVNETMVDQNEQLSNNVYAYDGRLHMFTDEEGGEGID